MGIFDRLSRLARSEANHLFDSARSAADDVFGGDADARRAGATRGGPGAAEADPWPAEIRGDYAALELEVGADRAAVKRAYRDLMRRYHPDRHDGDDAKSKLANELTVRIRESYERLDSFLEKRGA